VVSVLSNLNCGESTLAIISSFISLQEKANSKTKIK